MLVDGEGCIELASAAVETLFGYHPSGLVGQPVEILVPDQVRNVHREHRGAYARHPTARPMGAGLQLRGRRHDGTVFPIDVSLSPVIFEQRTLTVAFVRDATDRRRSERLMEFVNEVTRSMLAGEDSTEVLGLVSERARALAGAAATWVVVPDRSDPHQLRVVAGAGAGVDGIIGATLDASSSLSAKTMGAGQPVLVPDMQADQSVIPEARDVGFGPGVYFPMVTQEGRIGALVVARRTGVPPYTDAELAATEAFASAAAVGLALGAARESLENLHMVSEQERIARDLHDTVIQRLFALGMGLQGVQRLADERIAERIRSAVEAIDDVIREIRETIFDLSRPSAIGLDVRQRVRDVAVEAAGSLGYPARVSFRGPVEAALTEPVLTEVLSVLREALSNVARHSRASRVDVVLMADAATVTLSVADNGIGLPDGPLAGHGLENMTERAAKLGGECVVTRRHPAGTILKWWVPLTRR